MTDDKTTGIPDAQQRNAGDMAPEAGASPPPEAVEPEAPETTDEVAEHVEEELDELGRALKERDEYLDMAKRARADFENFRKRAAKEATDAAERGRVDVARQLIPVIDNIERAMAAGQGTSNPEALAKGIELVHRELREALSRVGLTPFGATGEKFDPAWHEAISTLPAEGREPGTVIETLEPGYRAGDQLLRAARVVVSE